MSAFLNTQSPYGRILVIDDDTSTVEQLTHSLCQEGYQVEYAEHTNRCFEKVKNDQVDVLIIAAEAWGNKACQLIPVLKMINSTIPIIVTSADDSIEIAERVREHGIFFYTLKPLDLNEVKLVVKNAISRKFAGPAGFFTYQKSVVETSDFEDEILDIEGASKILKLSKRTTAELAKKGEIPASQVGHRWYFIRNQLLEWLRITAAGNQKNYSTLILETMEDGVAVVDRKLKIVSCNSAYLQSLDVPRDRIVGEFCFKVSHRSHVPCDASTCPVRQAFKQKKPVKCLHINYDAEGNEHYCDIIAFPMKDRGGKVTHVLEVIKDNTEIYNLNRHLNWIMKFFAHESKKTLGPVVMNISALIDAKLSEAIPDDQRKDMLLSSLCSLKSLHDMIRNYIISYNTENSQLQCYCQQCDFDKDILQPAIAEFNPALNKRFMTIVKKSNENHVVYGDPHLLRIAVCNLINNAIKYGTEGSVIQSTLTIEPDNWQYRIVNEGVGIPRDRIEDVFDRFARFDELGISGTGLGLHVVKTIVEMHGGFVSANAGYYIDGSPIYYDSLSSTKHLATIFDKNLKKFAEFTMKMPNSSKQPLQEV